MKLLHVDAGITGPGSVSRQLSAAIVRELKEAEPTLEVVSRDLDADPIPHLDSGNLAAIGPDAAADSGLSQAVLQEFLDADLVVVGAPMYNFAIPSQLKAWFDRILIGGKTFRYTANGPEGLAGGKRVIIASARGGLYAPGTPQADNDFHEPYLRTLFRFIGIEDVTVVRAEGVAISPDHREAALNSALAAVAEVVPPALRMAAE
jgi:FMN-dependent NADH-azoreductase